MLADNAYNADRIRASLRERGAFANIPPMSNRRSKPYFSTWLYRERNLIEHFFAKLKHFRRVAIRYDKLAENFVAMPNSPQCGCGSAFMSLRPSKHARRLEVFTGAGRWSDLGAGEGGDRRRTLLGLGEHKRGCQAA